MSTLKLLALDADDLAILSAHVQDAVLTVGDMAYEPKDRRFVALVNRLDLTAPPKGKTLIRRRAALRIERVTRAELQGINLKTKSQVLALLAIDRKVSEEPAGTITLVCSGGAAVRLHVECIEASLADLGPAWTTTKKPDHGLKDEPIGAKKD
ncbi:MAG: hypothetical protein RL291_145 [Pseudomonadota bacterium]|jgi:hypothetical protein